MKDLLASICVSFIEDKKSNVNGGDFRGWNIYIKHSYLADANHVKLIQIIRSCQFPSATAGFGLPLRGKDTLLCSNCKSIDHNTSNCPFPNISGWMGFKPALPLSDMGPSNAYVDGFD